MKKKSFNILYLSCGVIAIIIILGKYKCPFQHVIGISCPMCGLTRAIYNALLFNFKESFYYHLLWPLIISGIILYILYKYKMIHINEKIVFFLLEVFAIINVIYYFYRLFSGSNIVYIDFSQSLLYKIFHFIINIY